MVGLAGHAILDSDPSVSYVRSTKMENNNFGTLFLGTEWCCLCVRRAHVPHGELRRTEWENYSVWWVAHTLTHAEHNMQTQTRRTRSCQSLELRCYIDSGVHITTKLKSVARQEREGNDTIQCRCEVINLNIMQK